MAIGRVNRSIGVPTDDAAIIDKAVALVKNRTFNAFAVGALVRQAKLEIALAEGFTIRQAIAEMGPIDEATVEENVAPAETPAPAADDPRDVPPPATPVKMGGVVAMDLTPAPSQDTESLEDNPLAALQRRR